MKWSLQIIALLLATQLFAQSALPDCKPKECPWVETVNLGTGNLNVRSGASTSSTVLGTVRQGVKMESRGEKTGNWYPVFWNAKQAFVSADYAQCIAAPTEPTPPPPAATWIKAVDTVPKRTSVCQAFGNKIAYQSCGFHTGTDICAPHNVDILAMGDGKVVHVGPLWLDGAGQGRGPHSVVLDHGGGVYSTYGHQSKTVVKIGDTVKAGQKISEVGSLGYSSGPHLHLEILVGTSWTGNWKAPFTGNACNFYKNPVTYR